ncbi:recombinase family protein [Pedobacter xixiisoli]|uniref:Resolvase, N terminal domain n=1 Tax=Pedobacter xixiisoli TaxID=1476464 RepID=A0A285ZRX2_9SPHI|nr:recombinase family protein [Pedobacter xixiisoli]SOD12399.1 Resolvase, N terminal domain [Pedobacter xixiisoli]
MNALGYMRLSSRDQSKSLEYQESTVREYCRRNNLTVLDVFKDNGESSYTFDRRDYLALEAYLNKYKGKIQFVIVLDHDRFSRNLPEALMKIAELEKKHGETSKVMLQKPVKLKNERQKQLKAELITINEKIYKLEERLVNEEIDATTYQTWFKKLQQEKRLTEASLNTEEKPRIKSEKDIVEKLLPYLKNLFLIYDKSNVIQKHTLIRGMFKDNLVWDRGLFRTNFIDPILQDNILKINKKGLLFNKQSFQKFEINLISTPNRNTISKCFKFI